jgi:amino acid permease
MKKIFIAFFISIAAITSCGRSEKGKEIQKNYWKSKKMVEYNKERNNKPCMYNGETMTLNALAKRFKRAKVEHPYLEAKKYLLP